MMCGVCHDALPYEVSEAGKLEGAVSSRGACCFMKCALSIPRVVAFHKGQQEVISCDLGIAPVVELETLKVWD